MTIIQDSLLNPFSKVQALRLGKFKFKIKLLDNPNRFLDETDRSVVFAVYERREGDTSGIAKKSYFFNFGVYDDSADDPEDPKAPLASFDPEKKIWSIKLPSDFEKAEDHEGFTLSCNVPMLGQLNAQYPFNFLDTGGLEKSRWKRPETVKKKQPLLDWEIPLWTVDSFLGNTGKLTTDFEFESVGDVNGDGEDEGSRTANLIFRNLGEAVVRSQLDPLVLDLVPPEGILWSEPCLNKYDIEEAGEPVSVNENHSFSGTVTYVINQLEADEFLTDPDAVEVAQGVWHIPRDANITLTTWAGGMVGNEQVVPQHFIRGDQKIWTREEHDAPLTIEVEIKDSEDNLRTGTAWVLDFTRYAKDITLSLAEDG